MDKLQFRAYLVDLLRGEEYFCVRCEARTTPDGVAEEVADKIIETLECHPEVVADLT